MKNKFNWINFDSTFIYKLIEGSDLSKEETVEAEESAAEEEAADEAVPETKADPEEENVEQADASEDTEL